MHQHEGNEMKHRATCLKMKTATFEHATDLTFDFRQADSWKKTTAQ